MPWAFKTLLSAKVTFNLSEVSLVDRCPNYLVTIFLAKKAVQEEVKAVSWNVNLVLFCFVFLSLGFLTFKNNFHLTLQQSCFPALHSVSQIYF